MGGRAIGMTRRPRHRRNLGVAIGDRSRHNDERALRGAPRGETYLNDRCAFGARWHNRGDSLTRVLPSGADPCAGRPDPYNENDCSMHATGVLRRDAAECSKHAIVGAREHGVPARTPLALIVHCDKCELIGSRHRVFLNAALGHVALAHHGGRPSVRTVGRGDTLVVYDALPGWASPASRSFGEADEA